MEEERTARACFVAAMGETTAEVEEPLPLSPCLEELRVEAVEESLEELFFLFLLFFFLFLDVALRGAGRSVLGLRTATMGDVSMERTLLFFVGVVVVDVDRFFFFFGVEVVERRDLNLLVVAEVVVATSSRAGGGFFVTFIVVAAVVVLEDSSFLVLLEEERLLLLLLWSFLFLFLLFTDFADVATAQAFFFLMLGEEDAFCSRCGGGP